MKNDSSCLDCSSKERLQQSSTQHSSRYTVTVGGSLPLRATWLPAGCSLPSLSTLWPLRGKRPLPGGDSSHLPGTTRLHRVTSISTDCRSHPATGPNAARADSLGQGLHHRHGSRQPCPTQPALQKAHQLEGQSTPREPGPSFPCAKDVTCPKTAACASVRPRRTGTTGGAREREQPPLFSPALASSGSQAGWLPDCIDC